MKYIIDAIIRGIIPFVIMSGISLIMVYQKLNSFQIKSTFLVGIIITLVSAASVIYEIDNLTLTQQSIIHFFVMLITVFPCLIISGWFPFTNIFDFLKVLAIFLVVGVVLWIISFFIFGKLLNK
ncbi:DUF3021 family protein [Enterococcus asini]|uniref:DUF3021 family protein n=1 Tax=Enterococcaceae TaxID=81852 RepID=UPI00288EC8DE|nr:DUF3021 family protein [Enterococcus asini]MDT2758104.1 DUF3021 family protein [Enterococcus asini]NBK09706.1 DUF3021 family protein [Enterococcus asini]GMS49807.1 DUF3021 family protein [Enterococcus gallinarum]GMS52952.1 DUF3021 family protein [Enterococcus gallinarum]